MQSPRTMRRANVVSLACLLSVPAVGVSQEATHAFLNARIIPVTGAPIDRGTLVARGSAIVAVGPAGSTAVPAGAQRHDVAGKVIIPGLEQTPHDTPQFPDAGIGGCGTGP